MRSITRAVMILAVTTGLLAGCSTAPPSPESRKS